MTTNPFFRCDPHDLVGLTTALVNVGSVSRNEKTLCDYLEQFVPTLRENVSITRLSNSLVVKVGDHSTSQPIIFAGHIDTVPAADHEGTSNKTARMDGDTLFGLGTTDMKSGVAIMIALLADISVPSTFVFYEAEEIADKYNGLRLIKETRPELLSGKWAILLEPTNSQLEMGCQGAITVEARFKGVRAHSARPWMGENAIHKSMELLARASKLSQSQQEVQINGLTFTPALQVTKLNAGIAANIIPDNCDIMINHRYSPDVTALGAERYMREIVCSGADDVLVISNTAGALPAMDHPLVAYAQQAGREVVPKVAWTDVARFFELGIPALNCGPGDPKLCHRADEHIVISQLDETFQFLKDFLTTQ